MLKSEGRRCWLDSFRVNTFEGLQSNGEGVVLPSRNPTSRILRTWSLSLQRCQGIRRIQPLGSGITEIPGGTLLLPWCLEGQKSLNLISPSEPLKLWMRHRSHLERGFGPVLPSQQPSSAHAQSPCSCGGCECMASPSPFNLGIPCARTQPFTIPHLHLAPPPLVFVCSFIFPSLQKCL